LDVLHSDQAVVVVVLASVASGLGIFMAPVYELKMVPFNITP